jgi:peroxiredoxin
VESVSAASESGFMKALNLIRFPKRARHIVSFAIEVRSAVGRIVEFAPNHCLLAWGAPLRSQYSPSSKNMKKLLLASALIAGLSLNLSAGPKPTLKVGSMAPEFKITDAAGKEIDLAKLTAKGPVLVRLTCGCLGCDLELPYFQALHEAYKKQGLTSLAVFAEPDEKFAKYAKSKKLNMRYALDPKRESWKVFGTKTMPSNILIDKGGRIVAVSKGCNPEGLKALALGDQAAQLVSAKKVDITEGIESRERVKKNKKK